MATTRKRTARQPAPAPPKPPTVGPKRYTAVRFLSDCDPEVEEFLRGQWAAGNQLIAKRVPVSALPPVLILACYARQYGVELVDDYDALIERYETYIKEFAHPDKFFSSSITLLHPRGMVPDDEGFESINVPGIYEELFP